MENPAQLELEQMSRRIQKARTMLVRTASVLVGVLQVLLGGVLTVFALGPLLEWSALTVPLRATIVLWIIAAPVAVVCGIWSVVGLGRFRLPLWIGGTAASFAGAVLVIGVLAHFIPCASPT